MIENHVYEWLNLLVRWIHFIVGVAWIGASFYFNWLENNLNRNPPQEDGIIGNLWAIHGGGFYHLKKFRTGPDQLPTVLHWFKWEAYATWLSGFALLVIVYYFNAHLFLIDPSVRMLTEAEAIIISIVITLGSWFIYDAMCRSPLGQHKNLLTGLLFLYLVLLAYFLSEVFSGRGAYIHIGAAVGTMMVGNVFFVIIPAQKEMVSALSQNRPMDPAVGAKGLLRSLHNNYLTLPILFIMVSTHFPTTYGHSLNWLVLALVSVAGIVVRHYFNVRMATKSMWWLLPTGFAIMVGTMWLTAPEQIEQDGTEVVSVAEITSILTDRCSTCHARTPSQPGFSAPPAGIVFDSRPQIEANAARIYQSAVLTRIMPPGNLTELTDAERHKLTVWYLGLKQR